MDLKFSTLFYKLFLNFVFSFVAIKIVCLIHTGDLAEIETISVCFITFFFFHSL